MVDLKLTADAISFRRMEIGNIMYHKNHIERERRYRYDSYGTGLSIKCDNLALALISDSLENHFNEMNAKYNNGIFPNSDKLFLVFTLPLIDEVCGTLNNSYVLGCAYLPICGLLCDVWVMPIDKDIIGNYADYTNENSVDISPYIDFEKAVRFGVEERISPKANTRFTARGISHVCPNVTDVILKVEDVIMGLINIQENMTGEELSKVISQNLCESQGRIRHKK